MSSRLAYDNALSQLTGMIPSPVALAAGHPTTQYEYSYDCDGWRSEKRSYAGGNVTRVRYLYYGNDLLAEVKETVNANGEATWELSRGYHWMSGGVGEAWRLLSVQDYERVTTALPGHDERVTVALPGYDGRGNVVTWTNGATGELIGTADYGPYGERFDVRWVTPADEASYDRFGFGTEYRDETGLIYYGARYYSPALGRFLSRDPAGVAGSGVNLYAFCGGDPVNNRELYGLCEATGFWGWMGSFFSRIGNAIENAIGSAIDWVTGNKNDDSQKPGTSDPGFIPLVIDPNGNAVVLVTDPEKFKKACDEYAKNHNGEDPRVATGDEFWDYWRDTMRDADGRIKNKIEFAEYLANSLNKLSSTFAENLKKVAMEGLELAKIEYEDLYIMSPFEVTASRYTDAELYQMRLAEQARAEELRLYLEREERANWSQEYGLNQAMPQIVCPDSGIDPRFRGVNALDATVTASVRLSFFGCPQLAWTYGVYLSINPRSDVGIGQFIALEPIGVGNESSLGVALGFYNTSNINGPFVSVNGAVGPVGGSVFTDMSGNAIGGDISIGVGVYPINGSVTYGVTERF
jgi:RHS repeat-associated protein